MKTFVYLALVICLVFATSSDDRITNYATCVKKCRSEKNDFRFCTKFCKPQASPKSKPEEVTEQADTGLPPVPSSEELWAKYRSVLLDFFRQGDPNAMPGLQFVATPFPADWDIDPSILTALCDKVPKWQQTYETTKNSFSTEYGDFILNVQIPPQKPIDPSIFDPIDAQLRSAENRINDAEIECQNRYDARFQQRLLAKPPTFDAYQAQFCPSIDRNNKYYDMTVYDLEVMQRDVYGEHFGLKRAVAKYGQAQRGKGLNYIAMGSMERFVEGAKANRTNAFEIKITSRTKVTTEKFSQTTIGVGISYEFATVGNASLGVNYARSKFEFNTATDEFQMIVGALGYKYFPVSPDRTWFSPEVLTKYAKSPLKTPKNYFANKDGTMALMPKGIFVVVGPRVTMLVSHEDASKIEKTSQLGLTLGIAGFNFNFAKNSTFKKETESSKLFRITIEGNGYDPQVIAVDNDMLFKN